MPHDSTRVKMGATSSSAKVVTTEIADPATFLAGLAVRRAAAGGLQTADDSTAALIGVSLGRSLSNTKATAVARKGLGIPLLLNPVYAQVQVGDILFKAASPGAGGNDLTIALIDSLDDGTAEIATDPESPNDIIINIEDGVTDATAIKDAIEADETTAALITATIDTGEEDTAQDAAAEAPFTGGDDVAEHGKKVYVNDAGMGCDSGDGDAAATGATYDGGAKTGEQEDGTEAPAAYIDIRGHM